MALPLVSLAFSRASAFVGVLNDDVYMTYSLMFSFAVCLFSTNCTTTSCSTTAREQSARGALCNLHIFIFGLFDHTCCASMRKNRVHNASGIELIRNSFEMLHVADRLLLF